MVCGIFARESGDKKNRTHPPCKRGPGGMHLTRWDDSLAGKTDSRYPVNDLASATKLLPAILREIAEMCFGVGMLLSGWKAEQRLISSIEQFVPHPLLSSIKSQIGLCIFG